MGRSARKEREGGANAAGISSTISLLSTSLLVLLLPGLDGIGPNFRDEPPTPGEEGQSLQGNDQTEGGLGDGMEVLVQLDQGHGCKNGVSNQRRLMVRPLEDTAKRSGPEKMLNSADASVIDRSLGPRSDDSDHMPCDIH